MTKETAPLFVPLLWALAAGQQLQLRLATGEWVDVHNPDFTAEPDQYRVKPEPRTIFGLYRVIDDEYVATRKTREEAEALRDDYSAFAREHRVYIVPFVEKL